MKTWLPILTWLPRYQTEWFRTDLIAGITLAAYLIPASLGDATLANLSPEAGLYACMFAGLTYWLFCSSRHTAITVTSAISLLVGASLGELAGGDAIRFSALAATAALMTGGLYLIGWLTKAGVVVNFVSETVLVGFKSGIALFSRQHAVAQALRLQGLTRRFLGTHAILRFALERNKRDVTHARSGRIAGVSARKGLLQKQARRTICRHREHLDWCDDGSGESRREDVGRRPAGPAADRSTPRNDI